MFFYFGFTERLARKYLKYVVWEMGSFNNIDLFHWIFWVDYLPHWKVNNAHNALL